MAKGSAVGHGHKLFKYAYHLSGWLRTHPYSSGGKSLSIVHVPLGTKAS